MANTGPHRWLDATTTCPASQATRGSVAAACLIGLGAGAALLALVLVRPLARSRRRDRARAEQQALLGEARAAFDAQRAATAGLTSEELARYYEEAIQAFGERAREAATGGTVRFLAPRVRRRPGGGR